MKIPIEGQQVEQQGARISPRQDPVAAGAGFGALAAGALEVSKRAGLLFREQQAHEATMAAAKSLAQTRLDMTKLQRDMQDGAEPGAPGFQDKFLQSFDDYAKTTLDNAPDVAKPLLERHLDVLRTQLGDRAEYFEATQRDAKRASDLTDTIDLHANTVRTDDTQFDAALGETTGAIAASGLKPDARTKFEAGAKNTLATSLLQGLTDRDPQRANDTLNGGSYDSFLAPGVKNALLERSQAKLDKLQAERDAIMRADVKDKYANEVAAIRDTGQGTGLLSSGMIQKAFPDMAGDMISNLNTERSFYNARTSVALSSPEEDAALLARYKPQAADYADGVKRRDLLANAIAGKWKAANVDPVGYATAASPALANAFKAAATDPTKLPAAIQLSDQIQTHLGIAPEDQHVLANDQAQGLVNKIASAPPDVAASSMTALATQYGPRWPQVFGELTDKKLPDAYQVLANVPEGQPKIQLTEALKTGRKALEDVIGEPAKQTVKNGIDHAMSPLIRSLAPAPNGATLGDTWKSAAELLAYRYINTGSDPATAVAKAASDLTSSWDFAQDSGHNARAPKGTIDQVGGYAAQVLQGLKPEDLYVPPRVPGEVPLTDPQRAQAYFRDGVQHGSQWVNTRSGDGWMLRDAGGDPVLRADHTPVTFTYQDAQNAPAVPKPDPTLDGPQP